MSLREFYKGGEPRLSEMRIKVRKTYIRKVRKKYGGVRLIFTRIAVINHDIS